MENNQNGKAWKFGNNIDTDIIMPSQYLSWPLEESYRLAFDPLRKGFADLVTPGDVIVAGANFGSGSSREQAPQAILRMGIRAVIASSYARIFYRNALNIGLYAIECPEAEGIIEEGDQVEIDLDRGVLRNLSNSREASFSTFPPNLREIMEAGGLVEYMKIRNQQEAR
jgi:3-isopropylmalate/(R)-2-methylmalate dehydratase small subunit